MTKISGGMGSIGCDTVHVWGDTIDFGSLARYILFRVVLHIVPPSPTNWSETGLGVKHRGILQSGSSF